MKWHGKNLGENAEIALNAIKAQISDHGPHGIIPPSSTPLGENNLSTSLSTPPAYTLGDKVGYWFRPDFEGLH